MMTTGCMSDRLLRRGTRHCTVMVITIFSPRVRSMELRDSPPSPVATPGRATDPEAPNPVPGRPGAPGRGRRSEREEGRRGGIPHRSGRTRAGRPMAPAGTAVRGIACSCRACCIPTGRTRRRRSARRTPRAAHTGRSTLGPCLRRTRTNRPSRASAGRPGGGSARLPRRGNPTRSCGPPRLRATRAGSAPRARPSSAPRPFLLRY